MTRYEFALGFILVAIARTALGQMPHPLTGQNLPPQGSTAVQVDIVLDTIRSINSDSNSWNGVHWLHLSWDDPRAAESIQARTDAWTKSAAGGSFTNGCSMSCDSSGSPTAGCCDGVWLPHLDTNNVVALSQEASYRWRIWVDPNTVAAPVVPGTVDPTAAGVNGTAANATTTGSTRVHWAVRLTAEYQSPFDFRAWPFEHQHLLFEVQVSPALADRVYLVMGNAALADHTPHHKGDQVPGWHVVKTTRRIYDSSGCYNLTNASSIYSITEDLSKVSIKPLIPSAWAQLHHKSGSSDNATVTTLSLHKCEGFNAAATAQHGPQVLIMDVMVRRTQLYYILAYILPLLLLDYMVFITYAMERSDLESRMGVVVTLVLAVSALQFTYDFPPASYLNAVQQITLMSYVLYFIVAIQSMVTSHICRLHSRKRHLESLVSLSRKRHINELLPSDSATRGTVMGTAASLENNPSGLCIVRRSYSTTKDLGPNIGPDGGRHMSYTEANNGPLPHSGFSQLATLYSNRFGEMDVEDVEGGERQDVNNKGASGSVRGTGDVGAQVSVEMVPGLDRSGTGLTRSRGGRPVAEGMEDEEEDVWTAPRGRYGYPVAEASTGNVFNGNTNGQGEENCLTSDCEKGSKRRGRGFLRCFSSNRQSSRSASPNNQRTISGRDCPPSPMADRNSSSMMGPGKNVPAKRMSFDGRTFKRMGTSVKRVANQTRNINQKIDADEAFAQLVARRLDQVFSWTLLVCFSTCVAVLLYINQQIGDHRMMLSGDAPANM